MSQEIFEISQNISHFCFKNKPILNPLGQNFPQQVLKSMSEIVYTSIPEIKQLSNKHGCKVSSGKPLNWIISSTE